MTDISDINVKDTMLFVLPVGIVLLGLLLGFLTRRVMLNRLFKADRSTRSRSVANEVLIATVRGPMVLWFFVGALLIAVKFIPTEDHLKVFLQNFLAILVIALITWAIAQIAAGIVSGMAEHSHIPAASLMTYLTKMVVLIMGFLVILQTFGVSITPILTALGVGGLAVALALQPTLTNLFAGIQILAARQLTPGDYVKLASGEEGYVVDVTWRHTTLRQLSHNIIVVPNSQIASTITVNYHLPASELSVTVQVGVAYGSDLEHVERVTIEVGREVMRGVEGGVPKFEPYIRYQSFGDSSINFAVTLHAKEFKSQFFVKHEFLKRLYKRYESEGIEIPYPTRVIYVQNDKG